MFCSNQVNIKRIFKTGFDKYIEDDICFEPIRDNAGHIVRYRDRDWEFVMYESGQNECDYKLYYAEIPGNRTGYKIDKHIHKAIWKGCECGGDVAAQGTHAFWCPKHFSKV